MARSRMAIRPWFPVQAPGKQTTDAAGVAVRDYIDPSVAGTAFGLLGVVNSVGDLVSSLLVGLLWTLFGAGWGFGYAVVVAAAGAFCMAGLGTARR